MVKFIFIVDNSRKELFEKLEKLYPNISTLGQKDQVNVLLYGSQNDDSKSLNQDIIKHVITFIKQLLVLKNH